MEKEMKRIANAFEGHTREDKEQFSKIHDHIDSIKDDLVKQISTKVSRQMFWTVIPLIITLVGGMFMFSITEIRNSRKELRQDIGGLSSIIADTSKTVSNIEGKLEPFEFIRE